MHLYKIRASIECTADTTFSFKVINLETSLLTKTRKVSLFWVLKLRGCVIAVEGSRPHKPTGSKQVTTVAGHCIPQDWASKRDRVFHVTRVEAWNNIKEAQVQVE